MAKKRKKVSSTAQKIGRGNPPKHTQFRKGTTGNPKGRPKGSKNLSTYLMEAARDQVSATVGGKTRKISKIQATAMQLATKAAGGDQPAIESSSIGWTKSKPAPPPLSRANFRLVPPTLKSCGRPISE
jgi:hypothetical protein